MCSFVKCHILVVGDMMLDTYVLGSVGRISPEAPVPVACVHGQQSTPGGAANVARNLGCLGCRVTLAGVCGHDAEGECLIALLERLGVSLCLQRVGSRPTTTKTRIIAQGQQLLRLDREDQEAIAREVLESLWADIRQRIPEMSAVVLSDYAKGVLRCFGEGDSLASRCIALCHRHGIPVLVDPRGEDWARYADADCVTPNTRELVAAAGCRCDSFAALCEGARELMDTHRLPRILLTRSEKGMALFERHQATVEIPTEAREVADVSGAGDTVIAVLAAGMASGLDWLAAARMANIAAGVVVGKAGTSPIELAELRVALRSAKHPGGRPASRIDAKRFTLETLLPVVELWRRKGRKIVFTNGCFDLLHTGHVRLVEEAANQGDKLIVAVNSDSSVQRLKGPGRPVQGQEARATVMAALEGVDAVMLFDEDTPLRLIEALSPDVLVKGGDYRVEEIVGARHVLEHGGRVHLAHFVDGCSTSGIMASVIRRGSPA